MTGFAVTVVRRVRNRIISGFGSLLSRRADSAKCTYSRTRGGSLRTFLDGIGSAASSESQRIAVQYYCDHRFDLLGSGWTRVFHGMSARGIENTSFPPQGRANQDAEGQWLASRITAANLSESQRIWRMIGEGYTPIDWHLDFKSGYRWSEKTWYRDIRFLGIRTADVKVPWELSRLQHLPQIAIEYGQTRNELLVSEIRNQMLDWIACNPPRFGVNWYSTMDVAIRVANIVTAYDLAVASGAQFDEAFRNVLRDSVYDHAIHIVRNLEWSGDFRGNHYLANVAGLLFAAAYLGNSASESNKWISFAIEEIETAVEEQFNEDGSNFEASTSYHRLSAEMIVFSAALILRLRPNGNALQPWMVERISRMGEFTRAITKPDGTIVQMGDNDSGRFIRLSPHFDLITAGEALDRYSSLEGYDESEPSDPYPDERHLDHSELIESIAAIFQSNEQGRAGVTTEFVRALVGRLTLKHPNSASAPQLKAKVVSEELNRRPDRVQRIDWILESPLSPVAFSDFGLYVLRSGRTLLCIRCGSIGQNGIGGHAHNDQLSFDLTVDGSAQFSDPGTYLYTPLPERRNEYRSVNAHNGPKPTSGEPGSLRVGLFRIVESWKGECLSFSESEFVGVMHSRSRRIYRRFSFQSSHLLIEDWAEGCALDHAHIAGRLPFSPGYGIQRRQ